jgi:pyruvate/2-oxoacid:ferredoxin oxidoreductase alpha subunit/ferredoxin
VKNLGDAFRRLFGPGSAATAADPGTEHDLDGLAAAARTEALLGSVPADSPAAALGLAMTGVRAACVLSGSDAETYAADLRAAAGRHVPMVAHLVTRAGAGHAHALGSGHEPLHALADTGAFVLVARDVQDVVWLTLLARCVSERALVPGIVAMDETETAAVTATVTLPSAATAKELAGDPEDGIPVATPAQRMLFGDVRRRIPLWLDRDRPALFGPVAGPESWAIGAAARRPWMLADVSALLQEQSERLAQATGRQPEDVVTFGTAGADTLLVAMGALVETARVAAEHMKSEGGERVGVVGIRTLRPFPGARLAEATKDAKRILVLERVDAPLADAPPLTREVRAALAARPPAKSRPPARVVAAVAGAGGRPVRTEDLAALCRPPAADDPSVLYVGVDFLAEAAGFPKRRALLDRLLGYRPDLASLGRRAPVAAPPAPADDPPVPDAVRRTARTDDHWDSLSRFWDQVGRFWGEDRAGRLVPDPHLALGALPPRTASLPGAAGTVPASERPVLDAALCTGCGMCWALCPHGALRPAVHSVRQLLEHGMDRARRAGGSADVLRSVVAKLAAKAEAHVAADPPPASFRDAVRPAFDALIAETAPPADRKMALEEAVDAVLDEVGTLPVSRTEPFWDKAPAGKRGSLALALDPDACTACGLCVAVCEPAALSPAPAAAERDARDRALLAALRDLPAASPDVIDRAQGLDPAGPAAALFLSPSAADAMTPGDSAEPGSGARLALRLALAAASAHAAARNDALLSAADDVRGQLGDAIRHGLLDAVPTDDLDALSSGLRALGGPDVDVAELLGRLESAVGSDRVDRERMEAMVAAAKEAANLHHACERAARRPVPPPTVLAAETLAWAATFPSNPFAGPVVFEPGPRSVRLAGGIVEGSVREAARRAGVLRRGRTVLKNALAAPEPAPAWVDLTEEERAAAEPLLLVLDDPAYARMSLSERDALLASPRPVVLFVLAENPGDAGAAIPVLARRDLFVAQSTVAHPEHLTAALTAALARGRPALIRVLAPAPSALGIAPDRMLEHAREAVARRAFLLFVREPGRLPELAGNPEETAAGVDSADLDRWVTLRELAGLAGAGVERAYERGRDLERSAARGEWEGRVGAAEQRARQELERKLTERLIRLSADDLAAAAPGEAAS